MSSLTQYTDLYAAQHDLIDAGSCAPMNACRQAACEALLKAGALPTTRTEYYKYTDVEAAFAPDYGLNLRRAAVKGDPYTTYRCEVPNLSTSLYFVVNDTPCLPPAGQPQAEEGVVVATLCEAARKMPGFIEQYYHRAAGRGYDAVAALNTLLAQDGLVVYIPDGVRLRQPLQIVNIAAGDNDLMSNRRLLVVAGKGAAATVLLCEHTAGKGRSLTTQVVEVFADEKAEIDIFSIEETNGRNVRFMNLYAEQQAGSRLTHNGVVLTCGLTRNSLVFRLLGEQCQLTANGAVVADGTQHADNNILVEHAAPHCGSHMLYKCVLDGHSTGAFAGKVLVQPGAQQTASEQVNANLCASPEARAYSQPMLEIYADDVKCNHGSTIGKLDETALFYMRQRGIPEAEARLLLQHAFINDVLRRIPMEHLRERLAHLVELRFRGELAKCRSCKMCRQ